MLSKTTNNVNYKNKSPLPEIAYTDTKNKKQHHCKTKCTVITKTIDER